MPRWIWWWEWPYSVESEVLEEWCRVNNEKMFVCLEMSIKCQDEYGDENERIVFESVILEEWCRVSYEKCLFVCLEMSIKCQDEYDSENERIVLSQWYWKSDAE